MKLTKAEPGDLAMKDAVKTKKEDPSDPNAAMIVHAQPRSSGDDVSKGTGTIYPVSAACTTHSHPSQVRMHVCLLCDTNFSDIAMFNLHMKAHSVESADKERPKRKRPIVYYALPGENVEHYPLPRKLAKHTNHEMDRSVRSPRPSELEHSERQKTSISLPLNPTGRDHFCSGGTVVIREHVAVSNAPSSPVRETEYRTRGADGEIKVLRPEHDDHADTHDAKEPAARYVSSTNPTDERTAFSYHNEGSSKGDAFVNRDSVSPSARKFAVSPPHSLVNPDLGKTCSVTGDGAMQVAECGLCGLSFTAHILLDRHVQESHLNEAGRFNCSFCPKDFASMTSVKRHVKAYHDGDYLPLRLSRCSPSTVRLVGEEVSKPAAVFQGFSCSFCGRYFDTPSQLQLHVSAEHPALTKIEIPRSHGTSKRLREHHVTYACPSCKAEFTSFDVFLEHLEQHVEEKEKSEDKRRLSRYKELFCTECKIDYETMESFLKHLEVCPGPRHMLTSQPNGHKAFFVGRPPPPSKSLKGDSDSDSGDVSMVAKHGGGSLDLGEKGMGGGTGGRRDESVNFYPDLVEVPTDGGSRNLHQLCYSCKSCNQRFSKLDLYLDHLQAHESREGTVDPGDTAPTLCSNRAERSEEKPKISAFPPTGGRSSILDRDEAGAIDDEEHKMESKATSPREKSKFPGKPSSDDLVYHCHSCRMCFAKLDLYLEHLEIHCEWTGGARTGERWGPSPPHTAVTSCTLDKKEKATSRKPSDAHPPQGVLHSPATPSEEVHVGRHSNMTCLSSSFTQGKREEASIFQGPVFDRVLVPSCPQEAPGRFLRASQASPLMHHQTLLQSGALTTGARTVKRADSQSPRRYVCQVCSMELHQFDVYLAHVAGHNVNQRHKQCSPSGRDQPLDDSSPRNKVHSSLQGTKLVYCMIPVLLGPRVLQTLEGEGPHFMCQFCNTFYKTIEDLQLHAKSHYPRLDLAHSPGEPVPCVKPPSPKSSSARASPRFIKGIVERIDSTISNNARLLLQASEIPIKGEQKPCHPRSASAGPRQRSTPPRKHSIGTTEGLELNYSSAIEPRFDSANSSLAYACKTCSLGFPSLDDIMKHIAESGHDSRIEPARNVESGRIACPVCGVKVRSQEKFMSHLRVQHLSRKSHVCPTCNLAFGRRVDLVVHMDQRHRVGTLFSPQGACAEESNCDSTGKKEAIGEDGVRECSTPPSVAEVPTDSFQSEDEGTDVNGAHYLEEEEGDAGPESVFICQPCRLQFSEEGEFFQHIETHEHGKSLETTVSESVSTESSSSHSGGGKEKDVADEEAPHISSYWSMASARKRLASEKQ